MLPIFAPQPYDEGPSLEDCDLIATSIPLSLAKKSHILLTEKARNLDRDLLDGLRRLGFKLDFGEDGTGWQFKYLTRGGGYYFNVGCSDLIVKGEIGLVQFSDIASFVVEGARMSTEPSGVCRRLFRLSHAAMAGCSVTA